MARFRIMVVDDDPDVRFVVTSLLSPEFETTQALNGLDALEKIGRYEPDMLLMDISMPVMNGIACCQAIQRNEEFSKLPVIYVSAAADPKVKEQALAVGGIAFVEKPFDTPDLIRRINTHFSDKGLEPRQKRFSPEEIQKIDATPLGELGGINDEDTQPPAAEEVAPLQRQEEHNKETGRTRRVFGKQKAAPPPQEVSDLETLHDEVVEQQPDYGAISRRLKREAEELRERLRKSAERKDDSTKEVAKPEPPVARQPEPEPEREEQPGLDAPPRESSADFRPIAPPPQRSRPSAPPPAARKPAPAGPSPAEILAQRRLQALGRTAGKGAARPRVLVIVQQQQDLQIFNNALKGKAEFLPLEDPVEALVLIARFQPDIVVMGIVEENFSGLQIAHMMKSNPRLAHIQPLFIQGPWVESHHLSAAGRFTNNPILRRPFTEQSISAAVEKVVSQPTFKVREKELSYGVYVKEVIQAAEGERKRENKFKEKQAFKDDYHTLIKFMAHELKDYQEPKGMDELKGVGHKIHHVQ